jgi:hypothetical protein
VGVLCESAGLSVLSNETHAQITAISGRQWVSLSERKLAALSVSKAKQSDSLSRTEPRGLRQGARSTSERDARFDEGILWPKKRCIRDSEMRVNQTFIDEKVGRDARAESRSRLQGQTGEVHSKCTRRRRAIVTLLLDKIRCKMGMRISV